MKHQKSLQLILLTGASLVLFSGCASNSTLSGLSGTYDADTFRAKHDPAPGVDYTEVLAKAKAREKSKLDVPSGTYVASTFREKYDPIPNVDYGKSKKVAIASHDSSKGNTSNTNISNTNMSNKNSNTSKSSKSNKGTYTWGDALVTHVILSNIYY